MRTATLFVPVRGYRRIELIEKVGYKWLVRVESGYEFYVYEDEFELN